MHKTLFISALLISAFPFSFSHSAEKIQDEPERDCISLEELKTWTHLNIPYESHLHDDEMDRYYRHPISKRAQSISNETLRSLTQLKSLALGLNNIVTDLEISVLSNLTSLQLCGTKNITNSALAPLKKLEVLVLNEDDKITNEGLFFLSNLKELDLTNNTLITDEALLKLPALTSLNLACNNAITKGCLAQLTNLRHLTLGHFDHFRGQRDKFDHSICLTDKELGNLVNLTSLDITGYRFIEGSSFSQLKNLTHLTVSPASGIKPEFLKDLVKLNSLEVIDHSPINDNDLILLTQLTSLKLHNNKSITDEGITHLSLLRHLKVEHGNKISVAGIQSFFMNLETLSLAGYDYVGKGKPIIIETIAQMTNLKDLTLRGDSYTDDMLKNLINLTDLNIQWCPNISNNFVLSLPYIKRFNRDNVFIDIPKATDLPQITQDTFFQRALSYFYSS